jgi:hypothetical protein
MIDDTSDLLLLRREVQLEKRKQELLRTHAIFFYTPHSKQALFHDAADFHYRYARTGNRFGKSEMGAAEDVAFALGYRPWLPENDPKRTKGIPNHPTKGLIVSIDWDKSEEAFTSVETGKLFKYIPKDCFISYEKNHSGSIDLIRVKHKSGGTSTIHLDTVKSFKQNPLGQETSHWDWIHYDEPPEEGMYKANIRGLMDHDGRVWFTCTPLEQPWIDTLFVPDLQEQIKSDIGVEAQGDFWMMTGATDDNPYLTQKSIERVMAQYTPDERETRRSGVPRAYSGLVYKEARWEVHVRKDPPPGWKAWFAPPQDHTLRFAIDYHPRKPHHVMFIATSPQEYHYIYAELFVSCLMSELVADIRLCLHLREPTVPGLIDPLSDTPNRVTDITPLEEVLRLGLPVVAATKDPYNGILKVKELFSARDRKGNPIIVVNSACRRTTFELFRGYIWDADTNKPKKENDDAMENLYRLALQGLTYIEPATINDFVAIKPRDFATPTIIRPNELAISDTSSVLSKRERFAKRYRRG